MLRKRICLGSTLVVLATATWLMASPTYSLTDQNSTIAVDAGSNAGMFSWTIDGTNEFTGAGDVKGRQWFWYRVGSQGPEQSLDTLTLNTSKSGVVDTNFDGQADTLHLQYLSAGQFQVDVSYLLRGNAIGTNQSDIAETINVTNLSGRDLDFHFFQYTDMDLNGTASDDTATHMNANTIRQTDPLVIFSETVVTPPADHWEIAPWATTINSLTDGSATTLSDGTSPVGPADVAWAFEWDRTLTASGIGSTLQISKDKNIRIVPTPAAIVLGLIGLTVVGWVRYRFA